MEICGGCTMLNGKHMPLRRGRMRDTQSNSALHSKDSAHRSFNHFWRSAKTQSQNDHKHSMALIHLKAQTSVNTQLYQTQLNNVQYSNNTCHVQLLLKNKGQLHKLLHPSILKKIRIIRNYLNKTHSYKNEKQLTKVNIFCTDWITCRKYTAFAHNGKWNHNAA